ncbi:MAG: MotA/TolQ/ExbB proton channel family protein [Pseudomonadota bacterium]
MSDETGDRTGDLDAGEGVTATDGAVPSEAPQEAVEARETATQVLGLEVNQDTLNLISDGGPIVLIIAGLSVVGLSIILWKLLRFTMGGAWRRNAARAAAELWAEGREEEARDAAADCAGPVGDVASGAMDALLEGAPEDRAREQASRLAKERLAELRTGLRGLEVIVTMAPLLGLLGTVLGMIAAFQTLQESGANADPAALAGGIWEALLTTAAGMAVAIPAGVALNYFESVIERTRVAMESTLSIIFAERRRNRYGAPARSEAGSDLQVAE